MVSPTLTVLLCLSLHTVLPLLPRYLVASSQFLASPASLRRRRGCAASFFFPFPPDPEGRRAGRASSPEGPGGRAPLALGLRRWREPEGKGAAWPRCGVVLEIVAAETKKKKTLIWNEIGPVLLHRLFVSLEDSCCLPHAIQSLRVSTRR
ncbi:hypothetical protein BDA96_09G114300 [Sorghum bicolor]|uniref:Uncharacterized protein n=2 Tax=Sorghum bicolor TaxID=4558 RepID=A0A1Z5R2S4_SORBI|nr:hypothetical protein BDA96_09G114300 [Sorghum bicolor]OQU77827.1 hypothetical protein SORBI_3009G109101 [Sorghum bicolor]OQU77828.1 hypothetical protein SORBI_3009G109101 [Sorghum bicolor]OQU77829.1 hypothetical protein SORBI_3009G109101 [Sorghum bicolor]